LNLLCLLSLLQIDYETTQGKRLLNGTMDEQLRRQNPTDHWLYIQTEGMV